MDNLEHLDSISMDELRQDIAAKTGCGQIEAHLAACRINAALEVAGKIQSISPGMTKRQALRRGLHLMEQVEGCL